MQILRALVALLPPLPLPLPPLYSTLLSSLPPSTLAKQAACVDCIQTLHALILPTTASHLLLQPSLLWAAVSLLASDIVGIFAEAALLLAALLRRVTLASPMNQAVLLAFAPL